MQLHRKPQKKRQQRQREEERRMSRRKKKIDLSKSKREIKKNKLDEQANLAKAMMTSSTLPPLHSPPLRVGH